MQTEIKSQKIAKMWDFYGEIVLAIILIFIFQNKTGITDIRMFELLVNTVMIRNYIPNHL